LLIGIVQSGWIRHSLTIPAAPERGQRRHIAELKQMPS
jgi:hypothetical protein